MALRKSVRMELCRFFRHILYYWVKLDLIFAVVSLQGIEFWNGKISCFYFIYRHILSRINKLLFRLDCMEIIFLIVLDYYVGFRRKVVWTNVSSLSKFFVSRRVLFAVLTKLLSRRQWRDYMTQIIIVSWCFSMLSLFKFHQVPSNSNLIVNNIGFKI